MKTVPSLIFKSVCRYHSRCRWFIFPTKSITFNLHAGLPIKSSDWHKITLSVIEVTLTRFPQNHFVDYGKDVIYLFQWHFNQTNHLINIKSLVETLQIIYNAMYVLKWLRGFGVLLHNLWICKPRREIKALRTFSSNQCFSTQAQPPGTNPLIAGPRSLVNRRVDS